MLAVPTSPISTHHRGRPGCQDEPGPATELEPLRAVPRHLQRPGRCQGRLLPAQYDASLKAACDDIDNHEGAAGQLYCTYDAALLADSDFTIGDLSTVDYFHPSLSGQAKMAEDAWRADVWGSRPPP